MRPWILAEANYGQVKEIAYQAAVLPLGATEPHNLHLPYGTDSYEAQTVGELACAAAWERGAKVILLPTIPYGTETNQQAFPFAMNVNPNTLGAFIGDLIDTLARQGLHKLVLLNSHGGNDFKPLLREQFGRTPVHLFLCNWYRVLADRDREFFVDAGDHGGEMETAVMLAYHGELVARNADGSLRADAGATRPSRFEAVNRGWVQITRPWHVLTTNTGAGDPHPATAEKGRAYVTAVVERLSAFLVELAAAEIDECFPL